MKIAVIVVVVFVLCGGLWFVGASNPAPATPVVMLQNPAGDGVSPPEPGAHPRQAQTKAAKPSSPIGAASEELPQEDADLLEEARTLKNCYHSNECDFPDTDPREYYFEVGKSMADLLDKIHQGAEAGSVPDATLVQAAEELLAVENGYVQAKAISLIEKYDTDLAAFPLVENALRQTVDAELFAQSLSLLSRYAENGHAGQVSELLVQQIESGGHHVSQLASERLFPFINASNVYQFQSLLETLPEDSVRYRNVRQALNEYALLLSGG